MRTTFARQDRRRQLSFNMTPMIDVVFLLLIFFMLVSTFASAENIAIDLPDPDHSQARDMPLSDRVIINCQPSDPSHPLTCEPLYRAGSIDLQDLGELSILLARRKEVTPNVRVIIRADRRLPYKHIKPVMEIVAENDIELMNIAAHVDTNP